MSSSPISSGLVGESRDSIFHIFAVFLRLGCFSFGGPAAHLGYFRKSFVEERRWLSDQEYGALVALSQFLPGPGSSQVGFALGMQRAGIRGGVAAFLGFTLPSFLLMLGLALATSTIVYDSFFLDLTHGLKLLAIVIVADACLGMFKSFCQQPLTRVIALVALILLVFAPGGKAWFQIALLILAAIVGWVGLTPELEKSFRNDSAKSQAGAGYSNKPVSFHLKNGLWVWVTLSLLFVLMAFSFVVTPYESHSSFASIFLEFFQVGSLVFGGGHVVLPLMEDVVLFQMTADRFLSGYSLAQAVPGPMFTLASFLGADIGWNVTHQYSGAILTSVAATLGIFLPGLMLMAALLPHWQYLSRRPALMAVGKGLNAAVVGFLFHALMMMALLVLARPFVGLSSDGITDRLLNVFLPELLLILLGWVALKRFNCPIIWLVAAFALAGVLLNWLA